MINSPLMKNLGLISVILLVSIAGALGLFISFLQAKEPQREVVIVAEDMSFTVSSQNMEGIKNPTLNFNSGEKISILFRNNDPGIRHDLVIGDLGIKTSILSYGEFERITFRVPENMGTKSYYCTFHKLMMEGIIVIE
mgnify:CR=1 FL=1